MANPGATRPGERDERVEGEVSRTSVESADPEERMVVTLCPSV